MEIRNKNNFEDAKKIREQVFMIEQGFENEFDAIDSKAIHITAYQDGKPIGCARTFCLDNPKEVHIGRLAVLKPYRKQGIGRILVLACEQQYEKVDFVLSAQCRVQKFYESLGYEPRGDVYLDETVPHIEMIKKCN